MSGMTLSQFDLTSSPYQNLSLTRKEGKHIKILEHYKNLNISFNQNRNYFHQETFPPASTPCSRSTLIWNVTPATSLSKSTSHASLSWFYPGSVSGLIVKLQVIG